MSIGLINKIFIIGLVIVTFSCFTVTFVNAHEPIFGLGPHTIFKGGTGIEMEFEGEKASGSGEKEREYVLHTEIIYGITADLAVTLAVPYFLDRKSDAGGVERSSSGMGEILVRTKYRFWRKDSLGMQDAAAFIVGIKLPTGDDDKTPKLGSGSTDFLFGLTAARESLVWFYFGDIRYRLNTEGSGDLEKGDRFFVDLAIGIRPWLVDYLKPDLVVLAELNWETLMRNKLDGAHIEDSGGSLLFISPSFFFTYRNWAVKGGVQLPVYQYLYGEQPEVDYRFKLAIETHY